MCSVSKTASTDLQELTAKLASTGAWSNHHNQVGLSWSGQCTASPQMSQKYAFGLSVDVSLIAILALCGTLKRIQRHNHLIMALPVLVICVFSLRCLKLFFLTNDKTENVKWRLLATASNKNKSLFLESFTLKLLLLHLKK